MNVGVANPAFTPNLTRKVAIANSRNAMKGRFFEKLRRYHANSDEAEISNANANAYWSYRPNVAKAQGRPEVMSMNNWTSIQHNLGKRPVNVLFREKGILPGLTPVPPPGFKPHPPPPRLSLLAKPLAATSAFQRVAPYPGENDDDIDPARRSSGATTASANLADPGGLSMGSVAAPGPVGAVSVENRGANSMASGAPSLGSISSADPGAYSVARRAKSRGGRKLRRMTRKRSTRRR
jgi:hypothetical protein